MQSARLGILLGLLCAAPAAGTGQTANHDPDSARLVTDDIPRFWRAWDALGRARSRRDSLRAVLNGYYLPSSPGLEAFVRSRIGNGFAFLDYLAAHRRYYGSIRVATGHVVHDLAPAIRADLRAFHRLYPDAVFPDIYFLIGRLNSGGTVADAGLLIGTEMFSRDSASPVDELNEWERRVTRPSGVLGCTVLHELMHYQQHTADDNSLLAKSIREGSADFVAGLVCGDSFNSPVYDWARPREAELWAEFKRDMGGTDTGPWLYGGNEVKDRPADVGYFIGSQITAAYYDRAADKTAALKQIFTIQDFPAFLAQSGYDPQ
jgi:hypothetical protein